MALQQEEMCQTTSKDNSNLTHQTQKYSEKNISQKAHALPKTEEDHVSGVICPTSMNAQVIPSYWKIGKIILILKSGKEEDKGNSCRPISSH